MKRKNRNAIWVGCVVALGTVLAASGVNAATYSTGTGIPVDPYQISVAADWTTLMSTPADWNKYFLLTSDIDFGGGGFDAGR